MTFRYKKSDSEIEAAFRRQIGHLRRSIKTYDEGHTEEAERLAASLYTLFFDGKSNTKSAAGLAGVKGKSRFPDSRLPPSSEPGTIRVGPPLCVIGLGGVYWPRSHQFAKETDENRPIDSPRVTFSKWWEQIVYKNNNGKLLSRMNLVFAMRNQDGGGHIDNHLKDEAYHWLAAYGDVCLGQMDTVGEYKPNFVVYLPDEIRRHRKWTVLTEAYAEAGSNIIAVSDTPAPPGAEPIRDAHWASMRQIAWEADTALAEAGF